MKKVSCVQMGGPATCVASFEGETATDVVEMGTTHVMAEHPEIMEMMNKMDDVAKAAWMVDFQTKFDEMPEEVVA